ncbi:mitochondrial import inner membrane translocase subunit Tim23 isoform X2 [Myotis lucifugus]|uniref:mitochondrial import inner membrane translocase subunit Tim23 isoform X2 n=1 Tax=Myotis lucifugus TaxID=59463 RepID=UPI000CCBEA2C|nr:mitochondrial import inner membrane translocase subunit Tim23 isoform X2 [Myotis lucifugus]
MEGGGGSGNKTTGGLAGFFGAGGAGYSHADLAGVPRPLMLKNNNNKNLFQFLVSPVSKLHLEHSLCVHRRSLRVGAQRRSVVMLTGLRPLLSWSLHPTEDTDEFILPTGANKTRGRFELAFFTIGGCCMTGAAFGAMNGLRLGLKETQNMAWSKPRNVQILNMVTRQGALWANTLGSLGGLRGVARGGLAGLTLTSLYALYNNWEHMKGSLLQQSL